MSLTELLAEHGPMTGAALQERAGLDILPLWQQCRTSPEIECHRFGRRYLRLDRDVEGYARLSPSIRREFQTYTVVGLATQRDQAIAHTAALQENIVRISDAKLTLARRVMADIMARMENDVLEKSCAIMAGDVVYHMAHTVPRPESSTGTMVRGSDLDIIIVTDDTLDAHYSDELDASIYNKKHFMLVHPDYREEIDYIIKPMARVHEQAAFDTFEHMVACKILHEGELLFGSPWLFDEVKKRMREAGVPAKIDAMIQMASRFRKAAEHALQMADSEQEQQAHLHLFYTREEGDEIY
ncbi:MAG: hypothetical protein EOM20_06515 [Spartobacteria bacterium]|nr:hypothetical protein [Spartobacteria bacterium]